MVSSGLVKMAQTANKTSASIKGVNGTLAQSYDTIRTKINQLESAISKSTSVSHIRAARKELEQLQRIASRAPGNTGGGGGFFAGALRNVLPALGIAGAMTLGGNAFGASMNLDSQSRAINFATGGQGGEAISKVRSINQKYGLSNEAGMEGFKTLAGSVRSLNIPLNETLRIYESVGAAAGAMGVNAENQKGIFLALGQIASKGTVSAEELRGQIGERLPGAFGIAAKAMGVSEQALGKMMQQGELLSKDFLPKFATELQKTFGVAAVDSAEGAQASYNRFKNTVLDLTNSLGAALMPTLVTLMKAFETTVGWVKENWSWLGMLVTIGAAAVLAYQAVAAATWLWTAAQTALNTAMFMNPVGLIIAAVVALVAAVVYAWNNFEGFRNTILSVWEVMKVLGSYIMDFLSPVIDYMVFQFNVWKFLITSLWDVFKYVFSKIGDYFMVVFGPIIDAIKWLWNTAASAVGSSSFGKDIASAWNKNSGSTGAASLSPTSAMPTDTNMTGIFGSLKGGGVDDGGVTKGITGGGPRVINITIGKMVEKLELHASSVDEGLRNIEDKVEETFLRILNSGASVQ